MAEFVVSGAVLEQALGANFGYFIGPVALFTLLVAIHFFFWRKKRISEAKMSEKKFVKKMSKLDRIAKKTRDD